MKNRKINRRKTWNDKGVSEIIGTVLTLSITMVLFSSVIFMVNRMPAPGDNTYTNFDGNVQPINGDWSQGAIVTIKNDGGSVMTKEYTKIYLMVNLNSYTLDTRGWHGPTYYGVSGDDDNWDPGESWTFTLTPGNVTALSRIQASILDLLKSSEIWTGTLRGGEQALAPTIVEAWVDSDNRTERHDPIRFNDNFFFYAKINDPNNDLDPNSVWVDMSSIGLGSGIQMLDLDGDGVFEVYMSMGDAISVGYYQLVVYAEDLQGHSTSRTVLVAVGQDIGYVPNLEVLKEEDKFMFSVDTPTHGDIMRIYATIANRGMGATWADIYFYVDEPDIDNPVTQPIGYREMLLSGSPYEEMTSIDWRAEPGGEHKIWVKAVVRLPNTDYDLKDNYASKNITILPTILLVDDDAHLNDMSGADTVSFMRSALESSGMDYQYTMVATDANGPGFDYGDFKLSNYDVVIWMTGYEDNNTLTADDQTNLIKYLTNTSVDRQTTGSLWVISQEALADLGIGSAFEQDYLHVESYDRYGDANPSIEGITGHNISEEWSPLGISGPFDLTKRVDGEIDYYNLTATPDAEDLLVIDGKAAAVDSENLTVDSRTVFFPWEFSRISDPSIQTQVAFKVILWLGNISKIQGIDLAISNQVISPAHVFFQETVNISATIRNNGQNNISDVRAALFIDGAQYEEALVSPNITGQGGTWVVYKEWKADKIGTHVLKWKVDPQDMIPETNEDNNVVSGFLTTGELVVDFRILVVDDDESDNNGNGPEEDDTAQVKTALDNLGYIYENATVMLNENGPEYELLLNYSTVIWVTGDGASVTSLSTNDKGNIKRFLTNYSGRFWLVGANCLGMNIEPGDTVEKDFFKIDDLTTDQALPGQLDGVKDNPITHGMRIPTVGGANADSMVAGKGAEVILTGGVHNYSVCYESNYKTVISTFSLSTLTDDDMRDELVYMIFHWFGKPDSRPELRITHLDVWISDDNPLLGDAYIMQATVYNVGGSEGDALVRFLDGSTLISSDSVSIGPDGRITAEIIWRPLFAGPRTINVQVDPKVMLGVPEGEVDEIFDFHNNNVSLQTYVYFFWDDMEDQLTSYGRWSHSSTVININGENPLDYFDATYTNMDTNIMSEWNVTETYGVSEVTDQFHSYDTSFFMKEPTGVFGPPADVLVSIVIDNSDSMTDRNHNATASWLDVAIDAAMHLVSGMTDASVVSVYAFGGNNVITVIAMTPLAGAGRAAVNAAIDGISQGQMTLIWDGTGIAYMDVKTSMPIWPDLNPAVVVLSDGADFKSNDGSALPNPNKLEAASEEWCPWHDMQPEGGYPEVNYPAGSHVGKYANPYTEYGPGGSVSEYGRWVHAGGGAYDPDRKGLLTSDVPIYTIGLALEHHDPPYQPVRATEPAENPNDDSTWEIDANALWSGGIEAGTMEYNLWRISNTSEAEYFYAPDPEDLEDIFEEIGRLIGVSGFNQTRAPGDPNTDKRAVTQTVNLNDLTSAKLSFWHKYNMLQGGNGGFLQVAYKTAPGGPWQYKYIIPSGEYTGGLYYWIDVYDDFNNLIKWCWNGVSGSGIYRWDFVSLDILPYIPEAYRSEVRVAFNYTQFGGGTGAGWWIDDVKLVVSRDDMRFPDTNAKDIWNLTNTSSHSGNWSWSNVDPDTGYVKPGIDNSLVTSPIDLTMASTVYLSAYFMFNFNVDDGIPPDGFRIEASRNGGVSWGAITLGARSAWDVSGSGTDGDDNITDDGKSYTGLDPDGDGWVNASSVTRINVDLTEWRFSQIMLRFRLVSNSHPLYDNYEDPGETGGFWVDDVMVIGTSIHG